MLILCLCNLTRRRCLELGLQKSLVMRQLRGSGVVLPFLSPEFPESQGYFPSRSV